MSKLHVDNLAPGMPCLYWGTLSSNQAAKDMQDRRQDIQ